MQNELINPFGYKRLLIESFPDLSVDSPRDIRSLQVKRVVSSWIKELDEPEQAVPTAMTVARVFSPTFNVLEELEKKTIFLRYQLDNPSGSILPHSEIANALGGVTKLTVERLLKAAWLKIRTLSETSPEHSSRFLLFIDVE